MRFHRANMLSLIKELPSVTVVQISPVPFLCLFAPTWTYGLLVAFAVKLPSGLSEVKTVSRNIDNYAESLCGRSRTPLTRTASTMAPRFLNA